ncbi:MAG: hypothetical protein Q4A07_09620 [Coriobacteriales bacterium]|nr:hypothetical protein [Coriobacteriales bacterium]
MRNPRIAKVSVALSCAFALLLVLNGVPATARADEALELVSQDGIELVANSDAEEVLPQAEGDANQQAVLNDEDDIAVETQSSATNTVFYYAQEMRLGSTIEREFDYDIDSKWEAYYYKFKTSSRRARYQVSLDSLSGRKMYFEVRTANNDEWRGSGGSYASNYCYTSARGYCYKDDADYNAWYYIKVTHYEANRYDRFRLTVTELPDIAAFTISNIKNKAYTGKEITQNPVVKYGSTTLVKGRDYTLSYSNNTYVGEATVIITGTGTYAGTVRKAFKIVKAKNPIKAKAKKATIKVKRSKIRSSYYSYTIENNNIKVSSAKGSVSYKNVSKQKAAKKFEVNSYSGKVTVPNTTKKGTYTMRIRVTAEGEYGYKQGSKTVTYKIVVK